MSKTTQGRVTLTLSTALLALTLAMPAAAESAGQGQETATEGHSMDATGQGSGMMAEGAAAEEPAEEAAPFTAEDLGRVVATVSGTVLHTKRMPAFTKKFKTGFSFTRRTTDPSPSTTPPPRVAASG